MKVYVVYTTNLMGGKGCPPLKVFSTADEAAAYIKSLLSSYVEYDEYYVE